MTKAGNSQIIRTITLLITIFSLSLPAYAQYSGGTGEPNDPYQIATAEDLMLLGDSPEDYDKHFILTADIDLDPNLPGRKVFDKAVIAPDADPNDNYSVYQGSPFTGVFDGNGHTILHLTIEGGDYLGLFGQLNSGANISNLGLEAVDVNGTGAYVGGLVSRNSYGSIINCYSSGAVIGDEYSVGGLAGLNGDDSNITTSFSTAAVSGGSSVGGLAGNNGGSITASYSTGTVTGREDVGGLVGSNSGDIITSYSTGMITGDDNVGGLVGHNYGGFASYGSITMSYSAGAIKGNEDVGGLVGENDGGSITSSFWDMGTSGQATSAGGTGLTTAEMQDINTFLTEGWDFVDEILNGTCDYWQISPGDYPWLRHQPGDSSVFPEGLGTADEPYLVRDARDLGSVWLKPMAHYRLDAPVDLSGIKWSVAFIPWFGGTLDGSGYVIGSLRIQAGGHLGLFGQLGSGAIISNLGLEAVDVNGTGENVGGLVGLNGGDISNCYSTGTICGGHGVGGLSGRNRGSITTSYSSGTVTGETRVGGLVGSNYSYSQSRRGSITTSYSTGTVSGIETIGGLAGLNHTDASIALSYSTSAVSGIKHVGGLVGLNYGGLDGDASIDTSYSIGPVEGIGDHIGGLVGTDWGDISASFWDVEGSGQTTSGGGAGKTTAEMKMASTFIGWWCASVWTIHEGNDYPHLWWEGMPEELMSNPYWDGIGTEDDPYLIYTAGQLNTIGLISCDWDKHFMLMADIDLSSYKGDEFNIIGGKVSSHRHDVWYPPSFSGVFDGNGHTISNFTYDCNEVNHVGLFGSVRHAVIKDLGLIDANVSAGIGGPAGPLIGHLGPGTVTGCYVERGNVAGGANVGGLVGYNYGSITMSYSMATVSGNIYVGGLAGSNHGSITSSYSTGRVSGESQFGGLVGYEYEDANITSSFWDMETSRQSSSAGGEGKTTAEMQIAGTFLEAGWDFVDEIENGTEDIWWIDEGQDYPRLWWESIE